MSYPKKDWLVGSRQSFFWYDTDKDLKAHFLVTQLSYRWCQILSMHLTPVICSDFHAIQCHEVSWSEFWLFKEAVTIVIWQAWKLKKFQDILMNYSYLVQISIVKVHPAYPGTWVTVGGGPSICMVIRIFFILATFLYACIYSVYWYC